MRCREASVGAIVQVVGMGLTFSTGLWPAFGVVGGLSAGGLSAENGIREGLRAGSMGLAGLGLSVLTLSALGSPVALPSPVVGIVGAAVAVTGAGVGGAAGARLRRSGSERPTAAGDRA